MSLGSSKHFPRTGHLNSWSCKYCANVACNKLLYHSDSYCCITRITSLSFVDDARDNVSHANYLVTLQARIFFYRCALTVGAPYRRVPNCSIANSRIGRGSFSFGAIVVQAAWEYFIAIVNLTRNLTIWTRNTEVYCLEWTITNYCYAQISACVIYYATDYTCITRFEWSRIFCGVVEKRVNRFQCKDIDVPTQNSDKISIMLKSGDKGKPML